MRDRIGPGAGTSPLDRARRREFERMEFGETVRKMAPPPPPQPRPTEKRPGIEDMAGRPGLPPNQNLLMGRPSVPRPSGVMGSEDVVQASRIDKAGYLLPGAPVTDFAQGVAAKITTSPELGNREFAEKLFLETMGALPTPGEIDTVVKQQESGVTREDLIKGFTSSPMFQMTQDLKAGKALGPLPSVPDDPAYANAPIDTSSLEAAVVSAAKWARDTSPELVARLNGQPPVSKQQERQIQFDLTTKAIGALRAHGLDVDRLGRQTQNAVGDPARYTPDALVLPDGRAIDIFGGDGTEPQFHDLEVKSPKTDRNTGITAAGGRLTSSTLSQAEEAEARAKDAPIDKSSIDAAVLSAAKWAKANSADLFARINAVPPPKKREEDELFYELMTRTIAALKAHGIEVERLARHTQHPIGDPSRYVNDAMVLPDGRAIDVFGGGDNEPQFHDLDVVSPKTDKNTGITNVGAPRSSSTVG